MQPQLREPLTGVRLKISTIVESAQFTRVITVLIVLNAITLGLETSATVMGMIGPALLFLDQVILIIFTAEVLAKLYAYRFAFFRSGWNIFDFLIVSIAWVPTSGPLSVLRAFRILRVLRLFSVVPAMRRVIAALLKAIPGMFSVVGLLAVVFYVAAVLSTKLFGLHPDASADVKEWFGTIGASMYTLFQIMTLESWSMGIVRPVMEEFPLAWLFFVPFIILTSFAVLNLFIGIIVDAMQSIHEDERSETAERIEETAHREADHIAKELAGLKEEIAALRMTLSDQVSPPRTEDP